MTITSDNQLSLRLAHYVPLDDLEISNLTKIDIVVNSLYFLKKYSSIDEIKINIYECLGIDMPKSEVISIVKQAMTSGALDSLNDRYYLNNELEDTIKKKVEIEKEHYEKIITTWIYSEIVPKYRDISQKVIQELHNNLVIYITNMVLSNGVESIAMLDSKMLDYNLINFEDNIHALDWEDPLSEEIALREYPVFITSEDPNKVRFLLSIIDKALKYLSTIVDPRLIESLKSQLVGKTLFLDSSAVYRIVGLQGEHRYNLMREVLSTCREMGLKLKVAGITLKELDRRIGFDSRVLREYPVPVNLASVGYNFLTEENFISTFWKETKANNITVEDFVSRYKSIDLLLESEGIEVEKEIPSTTEEFDELVQIITGKINLRDDHEKSILATEHDAHLIALINSSRNNIVINRFLDAPNWILTTDQFFIRFQKTDHLLKNEYPIAILPTQLLHLFKFIKPKDGKYNEIFLEVFSKSFISSKLELSNENIQKILHRIATYKGYTPYLAEKILSDQLFSKRYNEMESDGEKEDLIHEAIIEKAKNLEEMFNQKSVEVEHLEETSELLKDENDLLKRRLDEKDELLKQSQKEFEEEKRKNESQIKKLEDRVLQVEKTKEKVKKVILSIGLVFIYVLLVLIALYVFNKLPLDAKILRACVLSIIILGIIPIAGVIFDNKWVKILLGSISLIATVFACIYSLV